MASSNSTGRPFAYVHKAVKVGDITQWVERVSQINASSTISKMLTYLIQTKKNRGLALTEDKMIPLDTDGTA